MTASIVIVGAGFSGAVVARELAEAGIASLVVDGRSHVAGNAHTERRDSESLLLLELIIFHDQSIFWHNNGAGGG